MLETRNFKGKSLEDYWASLEPYEIPVTDKNFLKQISIYAVYAMQTYCFTEENQISDDMSVGIKVAYNELIISVKGREKLDDYDYWRIRGNRFQAYGETMGVDKLFYGKFSAVSVKFLAIIQASIKKSGIQRIIGIGHGSGGVYVTLALLQLWWSYKGQFPNLKIKIVTFGQPRIGNKEFARVVNMIPKQHFEIFRFTHSTDVVPHLPKSSVNSEYWHTVSQYWIQNVCNCPLETRILKCQGRIFPEGIFIYVHESQVCIDVRETQWFDAHNGPYLNLMMGSCYEPPFSLNSGNIIWPLLNLPLP
ncbi:hypothetical protein G9A89_001646 [Geosiphon pyriformis]|nr:hypothetical protein G9A89_001646 [Geosiphon pyriformis]